MPDTLCNLCVVLVGTRNPLNMGAAARAMSNFGVSRLRVVNPYDVAFREARSAVGAAKLLANAEEYANVADAVADCTLVVGTTAAGRRELQHRLRRLDEGARLIHRRLRTGAVALLFGSEKVGLSNHDMSYCHWLMRIPTREEHGSMNLGQAVAVCLYELARVEGGRRRPAAAANELGKNPRGKNQSSDNQPGSDQKTGAASGDLERMTRLLFEVLRASDYVKPRTAASTEEKLRRLVRRLELSSADADLWLGMLRQVAWKLGGGEEPGE